jgi:hypothetical protein
MIISLLIGGFQNGRLSNITDMNIRGWYLILFSLLVSLTPVFFGSMEFFSGIQVYVLFASMLLIFIVGVLNLDKKGIWLILIGGLFNIGIMLFNGFKMPVMMGALENAGLSTLHQGILDGSIVNYVASEAEGLMTAFTKFIAVPKPYPFPKILSIGDIIMSLGLLLMLVGEMKRPSYYGRGKMVSYSYGSNYKKR